MRYTFNIAMLRDALVKVGLILVAAGVANIIIHDGDIVSSAIIVVCGLFFIIFAMLEKKS